MGDGRGGPFGEGLTPEDVRSLCAVKDNLIAERGRLREENFELRERLKELVNDVRVRMRQSLPPRAGPLIRAEECLEANAAYMKDFCPKPGDLVRYEGAIWQLQKEERDGLVRITDNGRDAVSGREVVAELWVPFKALRPRMHWQ